MKSFRSLVNKLLFLQDFASSIALLLRFVIVFVIAHRGGSVELVPCLRIIGQGSPVGKISNVGFGGGHLDNEIDDFSWLSLSR